MGKGCRDGSHLQIVLKTGKNPEKKKQKIIRKKSNSMFFAFPIMVSSIGVLSGCVFYLICFWFLSWFVSIVFFWVVTYSSVLICFWDLFFLFFLYFIFFLDLGVVWEVIFVNTVPISSHFHLGWLLEEEWTTYTPIHVLLWHSKVCWFLVDYSCLFANKQVLFYMVLEPWTSHSHDFCFFTSLCGKGKGVPGWQPFF